MKKLLLLSGFVLAAQFTFAQVRIGLRGGLSQFATSNQVLSVFTPSDSFQLSILDAKYGIHLGIYAQFKGKHFFVQPEVLFNSTATDYKLTDIQAEEVLSKVKSETIQQIDFPILVGYRAGPFRIGAGPVGHLFLHEASDLDDLPSYQPVFRKMRYGLQAGAGLDIGKIAIDVKWEGNFYKFGDHLQFDGETFKFDQQSSRLIASLGIAF